MSDAIYAQRRRFFVSEVSRIVPGLYAWLATVLAPAVPRGASLAARTFALLAFSALVGSFVLATRRPRLARALGVYVFVACCFGAWACMGAQLRSDQLDAVRGALGAVGFLLHALAWGAAPRDPDADVLDNLVPGTPLTARHKPVRAASLVLGAGIVAALAPVAVAFGVERQSASLLAHATALGAAVLLIGASTDVALRVGKPHQFPGWRSRGSRAVWPLGGLTLAAGVGLIWLALR
ncbi:MAG TPA: hypothetical protein VHP33_13890 [Polyangiaceae bacterium]|nr:hypothetical protein [Polyangiaceae bacterium]